MQVFPSQDKLIQMGICKADLSIFFIPNTSSFPAARLKIYALPTALFDHPADK